MEVLIVSTLEDAQRCADEMARALSATVEVATSRRTSLAALRRGGYDVVAVDRAMIEADPEWADRLWRQAGTALPVEMNLAVSGCPRVVRELRAALARCEQERAHARKAAATELSNELKSSVTGLLLQSQLAQREPSVSPELAPKLRQLVELAGAVRELLRA